MKSIIGNTFTPKIKGIYRVTYLTLNWFEPSNYKGFVAAPIFIITDGGFDGGIYLITAVIMGFSS